MNEKMEQESSKEIYKKRKKIVEPVFNERLVARFRKVERGIFVSLCGSQFQKDCKSHIG